MRANILTSGHSAASLLLGLGVPVLVLWLAALAPHARADDRSGTGIPVIVLVDDSGEHAVARTNGVVQEALLELRDKMAAEGYDVKTEEGIAAVLEWDLSGRRGATELLRLAYAAQQSGRPEFDVRAVVLFTLLGITTDRAMMTDVEITISGSIYDAVAQRHLSRFGPVTKRFPGPADCGDLCIQSIARPIAADVAAVVGEEARRELASLTGDGAPAYTRAQPVSATRAIGAAAGDGSGLVTTYAIHFEDFTTEEVFEVIEVMETEFPEYVQSRDIDGTPTRGTYGYMSRASAQKIHRWLNLLMMDMGLHPDQDVQVLKEGTHFTLRRLDV